jgi:hypothetical protein
MSTLDAESIRRKREKVEAELEALRSAERTATAERSAIVGRAVLDHACTDPAFAAELQRILDTRLTKRKERLLCGLSVAHRRSRPRDTAAETMTAREEPLLPTHGEPPV